ncbi:MAG TPA: hypothetical protein VGS27_30205 [Candidatus Sulfotelmatobacter sp.]|nr:hypothetical protein [Candidatus Sulfotelmatobacter sp.]
MSIREVSPEHLAKLFHHYHQVLAAEAVAEPDTHSWQDAPQQERNRFVTAARLALLELATTVREEEERRRYFAKPGEAEWGC